MKESLVTGDTHNFSLPSVAVVILNWNGKHHLEKFLPSVVLSAYSNLRIIVADNASTDDSLEFLKTNYPEIEIILNYENGGFAKGYNTALKNVEADIYVLLNSDVEVTPDWIGPVVARMESNKQIAACQPKILSYHQKNTFEYAGAAGGWIDSLGYPFNRGRIFEVCEKDEGQYDDATSCFWASGAAFFIRAECFRMMNGFDEYFFAHQEEIDLCWRLQQAGFKIYVEPASVVYHVGGGTLPKGNSKKTFLNFRNNLVMMHKNLGASAFWKIPVRLWLDEVAAMKGLLSGDGGYFIAVMKAQFSYFGWIVTGKKNKAKRINKKPDGIYKGSVVWKYFIKKQKTFSEIIGVK